MSNVDYIGIYLIKRGDEFIIPKNYKKKDLKHIHSYSNFFKGIKNNMYHPNELSAEMFSFHYLDKLKFADKLNSPAMKKFIEWYERFDIF